MPEGVTVLEKKEIEIWRVKENWLRALHIIVWAFVIGAIVTIVTFSKVVAAITMIVFLSLVGVVPVLLFKTNLFYEIEHTGRYRYTVKIDKSASYYELTERYNVSKNLDGTYTLDERKIMEED